MRSKHSTNTITLLGIFGALIILEVCQMVLKDNFYPLKVSQK